MGIAENWLSFVSMSKAKADSHAKVAEYWDYIHNVLSLTLIVMSAATTLSTLLPITQYVAAALGAVTTLVSAIAGSMAPSGRRQHQMESSKGFRSLMLKMVRVETERNYEELWKEYNKELIAEPFLPSKYKVKGENTHLSMSPEFTLIVKQKEREVRDMTEKLEGPDSEAKGNTNFSMTPEFALIVQEKESEVKSAADGEVKPVDAKSDTSSEAKSDTSSEPSEPSEQEYKEYKVETREDWTDHLVSEVIEMTEEVEGPDSQAEGEVQPDEETPGTSPEPLLEYKVEIREDWAELVSEVIEMTEEVEGPDSAAEGEVQPDEETREDWAYS